MSDQIAKVELNIDTNRLISLNTPDEQKTNLTLSVFNGNLSFSIMREAGIVRIPLPGVMRAVLVDFLTKLKKAAPGSSETIDIKGDFDPNTKSRPDVGKIVFGRNDKDIATITFIGWGLPNGRLAFPFRLPMSFDISVDRTVAQQSNLMIDELLAQLAMTSRVAEVVTRRPRKFGPSGEDRTSRGGQGGGYNRGQGGGQGGGGGGQRPAPTIEDDSVAW